MVRRWCAKNLEIESRHDIWKDMSTNARSHFHFFPAVTTKRRTDPRHNGEIIGTTGEDIIYKYIHWHWLPYCHMSRRVPSTFDK